MNTTSSCISLAGAEPNSWQDALLNHPASWCMRALCPASGVRFGSARTRMPSPPHSQKLSKQTDHMGFAKWNSGEGNRQGGSESRRGDSVTASVNRLQIQANCSHEVADQVLVHLRREMKLRPPASFNSYSLATLLLPFSRSEYLSNRANVPAPAAPDADNLAF